MAFLLAFSPSGLFAKSQRPEKVFVIHSYDDSGQEGWYFQKRIRKAFKKSGIDADIRHFYFNLITGIDPETGKSLNESQFIKEINEFSPDILLINDDAAFDYILKHNSQLIKKIPAVFSGVSVAEWDRNEYPLLCGIVDRIDLAENGEISKRILNAQNPTSVLDHEEWDNKLREQIYENISDSSRFVNNGDFHIGRQDRPYLSSHFGDKVVFNFISVKRRDMNHSTDEDKLKGLENTFVIYSLASLNDESQIQIKYDICSNSTINLSPYPQLTAIREQFSPFSKKNERFIDRGRSDREKSSSIQFLGGYFTSLDIQIKDQVDLASRVLKGENPLDITTGIHSKDYYMDWYAMKMMETPLKYKDFKSEFTIVNVPLAVKFKTISIILGILLTALIAYFIAHISVIIWRNRKKKKTSLIKEMDTERKRRVLSMRGMESEFFTLQNQLFRFYFEFTKRHNTESPYFTLATIREWVDPASLSNFESIVTDSTKIKKDRRTRIRMNIAGEGYHWWDVYYRVSGSLHNAFTGVLINIDEIVADEERVKSNVKLAEEVAAKEYFIANITHDIRTPLNAIAGFSQIMVEGCSSEEAAEYSEIISDNADQMLNLIDDAIKSSLDDVDNIVNYRMSPVDISKVTSRSYYTNLVLVPPYLQFIFDNPKTSKPVMVNADIYYLNRVINNLIGNAFKYTPQGSVTFGWRLINYGEKVEIFVKDTGIGISKEDQKSVFERFFTTKNNLAGTGLGLYITKRIIDNHGGEMKLDSELGSGSKFSCILPVIKEDKK